MESGSSAILRVEGVYKRFGATVALDGVNFELRRGEVHGLLGENGAGKTTLCNIIYGMIKPDRGSIYLDGRELKINSPREAMAQGICMVHQEFMLIPSLSVVDNVILFTGKNKLFMGRKEAAERVKQFSSEYGLELNPWMRVSSLSAGEKQRLEIIKALMLGARILILDEPTSVLTRLETVELFKSLRKMAENGRSVILVTHKMDEVLASADRITILRQGKNVAVLDNKNIDRNTLSRLIVDREVFFNYERPESVLGEPVLRVSDVSHVDSSGVQVLKGVNLTVRLGEIVGICGVAGNGQKELVEALIGVRPVSGKILFNGMDVTNLPTDKRRALGMAYIPEDFSEGLVLDFKLYENVALPPKLSSMLTGGVWLKLRKLKEVVWQLIKTYQIRAKSPDSYTWSLSGGNKQKLLLAREFTQKPVLIISHNPTKGLDVAATEYVHQSLLKIRSEGKAVLLVSNDLDEVVELSDRFYVMYGGRLVGEFSHSNLDLERVAQLMLSGV
jgi:simple sugar transport system ATP-binding protein